MTNRRFAYRVGSYAAFVVLVTAGAAQSLTGSNSVFSDDIADGQVAYADIRDNAMTGKKILDNSITSADIATNGVASAEIADDAVTGAEVADGSVNRAELAFGPISDVVQVFGDRTFTANEAAGHIVTCPNSNPVPLSGGYGFGTAGAEGGFSLRRTVPLEHGWLIYGQNTLPQSKILTVYVVCGNDGSNG